MIAACALFWLCQVAFCQTKSPEAGLTANPVFIHNCARCHGATAEGRHFRGPALTSEKVANASPDDLLQIITNGKGHMPKFGGKLTPDEINLLVQQIKALEKK
jgi:mono/diheme cytochrome c family protein